jgi:hypothetical protein
MPFDVQVARSVRLFTKGAYSLLDVRGPERQAQAHLFGCAWPIITSSPPGSFFSSLFGARSMSSDLHTLQGK